MRMSFTEEQKHHHQGMEVELLAKEVFRYLRDNPITNLGEEKFFDDVESLLTNLFPVRNHSVGDDCQFRSNYTRLLEAITLLERRGLVMKDPHQIGIMAARNIAQNKFMVALTSIGMRSDIDDEVNLLLDNAEETVRVLENRMGHLDDVVRQYYVESIRAYQGGLYISSVICLGAASERAIHWLAGSADSWSEWYQKPIEKGRYWNISELTKDLVCKVIPDVFKDDKKFRDTLEKRLTGLGGIYRENRDKAGHPDAVEQSWSREEQQELLSLFRIYIGTICRAISRIS